LKLKANNENYGEKENAVVLICSGKKQNLVGYEI
jgi:hypothetical protein